MPLLPYRVSTCLLNADLFPKLSSFNKPSVRKWSEIKAFLPLLTLPSTSNKLFYCNVGKTSSVQAEVPACQPPVPQRDPRHPPATPTYGSLSKFGRLKVAGPYHSVTATSVWGLRTKPHSPLGDCCNCEAAWSHTCSISCATVGQGDNRDSEAGYTQNSPLGS